MVLVKENTLGSRQKMAVSICPGELMPQGPPVSCEAGLKSKAGEG